MALDPSNSSSLEQLALKGLRALDIITQELLRWQNKFCCFICVAQRWAIFC